MRKLGRILRRLLTALSLLLFVAVLAAWVGARVYPGGVGVERVSRSGVKSSQRFFAADWSDGNAGLLFFKGSVVSAEAPSNIPVGWTFSSRRNARPVEERHDDQLAIGSLMGATKWRHRFVGCSLQGLTVDYTTDGLTASGNYLAIAFPCWLAAIVFGVLPSWRGWVWWRSVRRRRLASREGRCGVCGYDLRASPQRCPECGTAVGSRETPGGGAV